MKIAILGSGISGLSVAQMLNKEHEITVYELKPKIGGLIKCERINDCLFHKVGGHVFNAKNPKVQEWFWSFFDKENEFIKARRNAKVYFNGQIIGYPIENYLYLLPQNDVADILNELLGLEKYKKKLPNDYENFEEFLKGNFGEKLYNLYFNPYNTKIWNTDLSQVPMEWLEGKLPMPSLNEIILNNVLRKEEEDMVHSYFYYPKENGSQFIVDRLSKGLNIITNFNSENIKVDINNKIVIENSEVFDKVIYTGDIRKLPIYFRSIMESNNYWDEIQSLKSNGTSNLFCETDDGNISWLYLPESFTKAHRIIYTGNFSDSNNRGSKRKTCVVEFSGKVGYETMLDEIKLLPGNLKPLSYNYEPNSYIIQSKNTRSVIKDLKEVLEMKNFYLLGRFAEWEYYNMDKAIEAAQALSKRI